ncbi:hypothetical protein GCM10009776_24180 [Microbacterium deminutum]|uniref:Secreted protein n=1 Tax=Microbacterium deminutum TaxID=344164 RepID=A0ABP5CA53_9MICO
MVPVGALPPVAFAGVAANMRAAAAVAAMARRNLFFIVQLLRWVTASEHDGRALECCSARRTVSDAGAEKFLRDRGRVHPDAGRWGNTLGTADAAGAERRRHKKLGPDGRLSRA